MSLPAHNFHSDSPCPEVLLRRDLELPSAHAYEYVPVVEPTGRAQLIPDSTLARMGLFAACLCTWLVVGVELVAAVR